MDLQISPPAEKTKTALIARLVKRARGKDRRPKKLDPGVFVGQFYANVAAADLLGEDEDALLAGALSVWKHMQSRPRGKAKIRAFNPTRERDGWTAPDTIIEIVTDDMPFLVASVTAALSRRDQPAQLVIHPVVCVRRDGRGRLTAIYADRTEAGDAEAESVMQVRIGQLGAAALGELRKRLELVLGDVRHAVGDWSAMRVRLAEVTAELESAPPPLPAEDVEEVKHFLNWIGESHFTFLGYREYRLERHGKKTVLQRVPKSGLGVLRRGSFNLFDIGADGATLPPDLVAFMDQPSLVYVSKANTRSTVRRAVPLDTIAVKRFDAHGVVTGQRIFAGLFTSDVYNHSVSAIPLLRRKVDAIVNAAGFFPNSHDGKALLHILETLPRDELLQVDTDSLLQTSLGVLNLQERQRVALFVHRDPFGRYVSCFVYVPRDRYDTRLRRGLQRILESGFGGTVSAQYTQVSDSPLARLHFIIRTKPGKEAPESVEEIEARLAEAARDWRDDLSRALIRTHGEEAGRRQFERHGDAFPAAYREAFSAEDAVADIAHIEAASETGRLGYQLYRREGTVKNSLRFKLFSPGGTLPLSDVLPMLENMGLRVMDEIPHRIAPAGADFPIWIHDFGLIVRSGAAVDVEACRPLFEEAFARIWHGEAEDDGFNKLVLGAGLSARQIVVLRGYCKFLLQARIPFSQAYMEETLARHPDITRMIVDLFHATLDPAAGERAPQRAGQLRSRIQTALDGVSSLDEDRILRRFLNVVECTLRTNYFQNGEDGAPKPYVSYKLDSRALEELPLPRPHVEVFVHSPRVDAIHLRGGPIARGGIRWSDRREDFRTEVLGLMKSQMTKNAVIVPVGAKGGFVVKQPPEDGDRETLQQEGIYCYKTFMRGLLDITDNMKSGKVVPPRDVVRRDGDDPYLVVAADKGTATFSDIANGISREYGFWLDDAFASGGSAGYDHKAMGITARGAWESVKRHFREMGVDVMSADFTAVGVGDMSGDVFGNGMIYTPHVRLIGAFNHLHIFVDPDPDAAKGFEERKRLFALPRSSWSDYAPELISKGGGVFSRSAKSIKVTPEMRAVFPALTRDAVPPNELIRAILRAPVDLLWFGGIGTYIKSRSESNADVGDRINESVRVDAREIEARVIGEGANLAVTQLGRVQYALRGGRINTDFIDNSAGVDCSDHEVNIKILLGAAEAGAKLTRARRDKTLADMTDDVAALVLTDNYRQSMALTHAEHQSFALIDEHRQFMHELERSGDLDRAVEFLPPDDELDQRRSTGGGLTRPELSVLLAYAKIVLFEHVLDSQLPDDPYLVNGLELYFPPLLRRRYHDLIPGHPLRREIIATYVANTLVNRTGPGFVSNLHDRTGAAASNIARAYLICRQVFRVAELWAGVEALDNSVPADVQTEMHLEILEIVKRGTMWFLRHGGAESRIDGTVKIFRDPVAAIEDALGALIADSLKADVEERAERYEESGVPAALARRVANLDALAPACDIVRISAGNRADPVAVARIYYGLGRDYGFDWLRDAAFRIIHGDRWARSAAFGLVDDLYSYQAALVTRILDLAGSPELVPAMIGAWAESHGHAIARVRAMIGELKTAKTLDLPMLMVVGSEIRGLSQL